jgi:hypothetical protein
MNPKEGIDMNASCLSGAAPASPGANRADLPRLHGDGVNDDTAAIQARLDSGLSCVHLPPPAKEYLISKTLLIGSEQELRLDRMTRIRLAPWSNCPMLENRNQKTGDKRIAVTGGIWDCDNVSQRCNPGLWKLADDPEKHKPTEYPDRKYHEGRYIGVGMNFYKVEGIAVRNLTIRNPVMYSAKFCHVSYFTIEDIECDQSKWNPAKSNMDGIHLDGNCHHGRIANIRGTTFDDLIALNANDGFCAQEEGPISDIEIDGVFADYSHSAVRILSASKEAPVERVTIRGIHGNFYRYMVGLTRFFHQRPGRGVIDDIVIEDCYCGLAPWPDDLPPLVRGWFSHMPVVFCDNGVDIGDLTVRGLHRVERSDPAPTISVGSGTTIANLVVRDCVQENRTDRPLVFLQNRGKIVKKTMDAIALHAAPGAAENILETEEKLWTDKGHVADLVKEGKPVDGYYPDANPGEY